MPLPCSLKGNGVWQSGIQINHPNMSDPTEYLSI